MIDAVRQIGQRHEISERAAPPSLVDLGRLLLLLYESKIEPGTDRRTYVRTAELKDGTADRGRLDT